MENEVQIFEHEHFDKLRVVMIEEASWFVAVDVCKALELKNSRDVIARLDKDEKRAVLIPTRGVGSSDTQGNYQCMNIVNEPGLYRLIFASRKREARDSQRWVYHEVLPNIRKTGSYSVLKTKPAPTEKRLAFTAKKLIAAVAPAKLIADKKHD